MLREKFQELERVLLHERHLLSISSGVPFVLLVYPPVDERECRDRREDLMAKMRTRQMPVVEHKIDTFIFDYYETRLAKRGGLQALFDLERSNRNDLQRMVTGIYEPELVARVLETVRETERRVGDNGSVFLTGVATMYPFGRVSNLLKALENKIRLPFVVFYPGSYRDGMLAFLDLGELHPGYRARVIA
jgi:hypothetical protein